MANLKLYPNVIEGEELETLYRQVFGDVAKFVSRTYGPFGGNTQYQFQGTLLSTKDGFTVEKEFTYSKNILANVIRKMIIDVSQSINVHAGDGTTTGAIAANELNNLLLDYKKTRNIHSKHLMNALEYVVDKICGQLKTGSVQVTDENMKDIIFRIASVSLDWDKEFANFITEIYETTKNPIIRVKDSGYDKSFVEYMNGYDINAKLISDFKITETAYKKCIVNKPYVLIFNHTLSASLFDGVIAAATYLATQEPGRELVVIATDFEKEFRDTYNAVCVNMAKKKQPLPNLVLVRYFAEYNIEREMMNDFTFLLGATPISRELDDCEIAIKEMGRFTKTTGPIRGQFPNDKEFRKAQQAFEEEVNNAISTFMEEFDKCVGTCDTLSVDDKLLIADGFNGIEKTEAFNKRIVSIESSIDTKVKEMSAKSMFTDEVKLKKLRLGKLNLSMGVINVGGYGSDNLKSKRDALDDAINACNNAYLDGVVKGGGIAIPLAIDNIINAIENDIINPEDEADINKHIVVDILNIFRQGFVNTWKVMLGNKYTEGFYNNRGTTLTLDDIINEAIENRCPWNLLTDSLDDKIIHPLNVETEVVKGCLHLLANTIATNQLFYNGYEGVDAELDDMREVKEDEDDTTKGMM